MKHFLNYVYFFSNLFTQHFENLRGRPAPRSSSSMLSLLLYCCLFCTLVFEGVCSHYLWHSLSSLIAHSLHKNLIQTDGDLDFVVFFWGLSLDESFAFTLLQTQRFQHIDPSCAFPADCCWTFWSSIKTLSDIEHPESWHFLGKALQRWRKQQHIYQRFSIFAARWDHVEWRSALIFKSVTLSVT